MKTVFIISYRGTRYCGWQVQKNSISVQKVLQNAIEKVLGEEVSLSGCGRTDAGVHANEFYCHLDREITNIDHERLPLAINTVLPDDICVLKALKKDDDFHSRYVTKGKEYKYLIWNSSFKNVFMEDTALKYPRLIDTEQLNELAKPLIGKHDFSSFMSKGSKIKDRTRDVWYFKAEREGDLVSFKIAADGFLYNMVRIIGGTLLEIASGKIKTPLEEIIYAKNRGAAGYTLAPHGLYLNKVFYD
ncbi:tRNA pseudouridine(38-40) synthase TruA [Eubacteriales bacterium OttesenSCG-928-G02]|nr:tRNA pseudouridine(38-40) synthase TruA [Eubacteriales bacterium OttesenSCG-928-G02]